MMKRSLQQQSTLKFPQSAQYVKLDHKHWVRTPANVYGPVACSRSYVPNGTLCNYFSYLVVSLQSIRQCIPICIVIVDSVKSFLSNVTFDPTASIPRNRICVQQRYVRVYLQKQLCSLPLQSLNSRLILKYFFHVLYNSFIASDVICKTQQMKLLLLT